MAALDVKRNALGSQQTHWCHPISIFNDCACLIGVRQAHAVNALHFACASSLSTNDAESVPLITHRVPRFRVLLPRSSRHAAHLYLEHALRLNLCQFQGCSFAQDSHAQRVRFSHATARTVVSYVCSRCLSSACYRRRALVLSVMYLRQRDVMIEL